MNNNFIIDTHYRFLRSDLSFLKIALCFFRGCFFSCFFRSRLCLIICFFRNKFSSEETSLETSSSFFFLITETPVEPNPSLPRLVTPRKANLSLFRTVYILPNSNNLLISVTSRDTVLMCLKTSSILL